MERPDLDKSFAHCHPPVSSRTHFRTVLSSEELSSCLHNIDGINHIRIKDLILGMMLIHNKVGRSLQCLKQYLSTDEPTTKVKARTLNVCSIMK